MNGPFLALLAVVLVTCMSIAAGQLAVAALVVTVTAVVALRPPVWCALCVVVLSVPAGALPGQPFLHWYDLAFLLTVLCWLLRPQPLPRRLRDEVAVLLSWSLLCTLLATYKGTAVGGLVLIVESAVLLLIAASTPRERAATVAVRVAASVYVMSGVVAVQSLLSVSGQGGIAAGAQRSAGGLETGIGRVNFLAALMVLGPVAALASWPLITSRTTKTAILLGSPLLVAGLLAAGSKNQLVALVGLVVFVMVLPSRVSGSAWHGLSRRLLLAAGLAVASWLSYGYLSLIFAPVAQTGVLNYSTLQQRFDLWERVWAITLDNVVVGIGPNGLRRGTSTFYQAHDLFLQVAVETGALGLLLFLRVYLAPLRQQVGPGRTMAERVLVGLTLSGLAEPTFRSAYYDPPAWILLGAVVALSGGATLRTTSEQRGAVDAPAPARGGRTRAGQDVLTAAGVGTRPGPAGRGRTRPASPRPAPAAGGPGGRTP